jgi:hypothetical protein
MESQRTGFPPFPLLLEIPPGFPHSHRVDDRFRSQNELNLRIVYSFRLRKGVVTNVSGPQRNACRSTLTPLASLSSLYVRVSAHDFIGPALRAATGPLKWVAEDAKRG